MRPRSGQSLLVLAISAILCLTLATQYRGPRRRPGQRNTAPGITRATHARADTATSRSTLGTLRRWLRRHSIEASLAVGLGAIAVAWETWRGYVDLHDATSWLYEQRDALNRFSARDVTTTMVVGGIISLLLLLWLIPMVQVALTRGLKHDQRFEAEQEARKTLVQLLAGAFVLVTWYQTWASTQVQHETQLTSRFSQAIEQLSASSDDGSVTGVGQIDRRVGGIYALERLTRDSAIDYGRTIDTLSLYARRHAPRTQPVRSSPVAWTSQTARTTLAARSDAPDPPVGAVPTAPAPRYCQDRTIEPRPRDDVQAVIYVIGRRPENPPDSYVDISNTELRGACLIWGNFKGVTLARADLRQTVLTGANLTAAEMPQADLSWSHIGLANMAGTDLRGASLLHATAGERNDKEKQEHPFSVDLHGANLTGADLREAQLDDAGLSDATMDRSDLRGASFRHAFMQHAWMRGRVSLNGADLRNADLRYATLTDADLRNAIFEDSHLRGTTLTNACLVGTVLRAWLGGADLTGADLRGADLSNAFELTWDQVRTALTDDDTRLPAWLDPGDPEADTALAESRSVTPTEACQAVPASDPP